MCWKDTDTCVAGARREQSSSIKSSQFRDAPFLGKAHRRLPPCCAGSLACVHPHLTKCMVLFSHFSHPSSFTHFAMLVYFVVTLGRKRTQMYTTSDLTSPLVVVLLHKGILQSSTKTFSHTSDEPSISAISCWCPLLSPTLNGNSLYGSHFTVQGSCVDMYNALWGSTYCNVTCWHQ